MSSRFALVHTGNDEAYGLLFVAHELLRHGHEIKWFDGDLEDAPNRICGWHPDFVCFSPLTTYFEKCVRLGQQVKKLSPDIHTVFGGYHVLAVPESINRDGIDIIVIGPVYGTIDKILSSGAKNVLKGVPVPPEKMSCARREYYEAIPRMAKKYRKYIMSRFGCAYNCSYCSISLLRKAFGEKTYKDFWMARRPVGHLIEEAIFLAKYPLKEVSFEDDDILAGEDAQTWLVEFVSEWKRKINIPMYANVTPITVVKASDKTLKTLSKLVNSVQMGVQVSRPESLKLFNRAFQKESQVKEAYDKLVSFGIKVKLEIIVGLPVDDPVEDAIETVKMAQRIGPGTFVACFPLMLYPGTALYEMCRAKNIPLNEACEYEWHSGEGSIKFDPETARKIKNITKMATMFVKYCVDERWMRALIDMDLTDQASRQLAECQLLESLLFRQGEKAGNDFKNVLAGMHLKY